MAHISSEALFTKCENTPELNFELRNSLEEVIRSTGTAMGLTLLGAFEKSNKLTNSYKHYQYLSSVRTYVIVCNVLEKS